MQSCMDAAGSLRQLITLQRTSDKFGFASKITVDRGTVVRVNQRDGHEIFE